MKLNINTNINYKSSDIKLCVCVCERKKEKKKKHEKQDFIFATGYQPVAEKTNISYCPNFYINKLTQTTSTPFY